MFVSDSTGKLGFHEFKHLWNNIKKWQGVYKTYDTDGSGVIGADELPNAFRVAGFRLNDQLFQMIIRRYSEENGDLDFDNYIGCLVRLDAMCRAFNTLDNGTIKVNVQETTPWTPCASQPVPQCMQVSLHYLQTTQCEYSFFIQQKGSCRLTWELKAAHTVVLWADIENLWAIRCWSCIQPRVSACFPFELKKRQP
ncbi:calpain small subunit 1-like isoform X1 [Salvelinus alpinus]|uniref:calpain small subunit 1-like isoform X1 n=1 Tax=Salvelinus alpinus TaxID=8036 RepID=UPI0039FD7A82